MCAEQKIWFLNNTGIYFRIKEASRTVLRHSGIGLYRYSTRFTTSRITILETLIKGIKDSLEKWLKKMGRPFSTGTDRKVLILPIPSNFKQLRSGRRWKAFPMAIAIGNNQRKGNATVSRLQVG